MEGYTIKSYTYIVDDKKLTIDEPFGEKYKAFIDSLTNEQKERLRRITTTMRVQIFKKVDYPYNNGNV